MNETSEIEIIVRADIKPTEDILKKLGDKKGKKILVGFAAETDNVKKNAQEKIKSKNLDLIVANNVSDPKIGFGSEKNEVWLISREGKSFSTGIKSKSEISRIIWNRIGEILEKGSDEKA